VVDNASTDGTAEIVRQFKGVRLICNTQNLGFAAGVNRGAKVAQGDWLLLLNPDCVVDEMRFQPSQISFKTAVTKLQSLGFNS